MRNNAYTSVFTLLRISISALIDNKVIILPFLSVLFIQLLTLEIIYFSPRYPLNVFFSPIIQSLWGENYLHYPDALALFPKLFQNAQIPLYLFVFSFFLAVGVGLVAAVNSGKTVKVRHIAREAMHSYVHIVAFAFLSFLLVACLSNSYDHVLNGLLYVPGENKILGSLREIMVQSPPFVNFVLNIIVTAFFAFILPIIVIDKGKLLMALRKNFGLIRKHFWFLVGVVGLPSLLFLPVLLLRNLISDNALFLESKIFIIILSVVVTIIIDSIVYTAVTIYYLSVKERQ